MARGVISVWTDDDIQKLKSLAARRTMFFTEIAKELGRDSPAVRRKAKQLGINYTLGHRMGEWNNKHSHLREPVLRYYLNHSFEETADHFGLTRSELKSCITNGYKDPKLKKLRKESRPHSAWTTEDWVFMVQNVGIQPREWIGRKLKRGTTYNSVKDALAKFRGYAKYMNGMPLQWWRELFGEEAARYSILTKAGPTGSKGVFHYRIIPWVTCDRLIREGKLRRIYGKGKITSKRKARAPKIKVDPELISAIRSMAQFQRWIYGLKSEQAIIRTIRETLKRK